MKAGDVIHVRETTPMGFALLLFLAMFVLPCAAIDNPDAPDFVAEFEARALKFEINVQNQGGNVGATDRAYSDYEKFLEHELNRAYSALKQRVSVENKKNLVDSQKRWNQFRDAEFLFVVNNWTAQNFGSSYVISRGASRTKIIRDRTVELLHYLKNY